MSKAFFMIFRFAVLFILLVGGHTCYGQLYVIRIAGNDSIGFQGDGGPAINASMYNPYGICRDKNGDLYIADDLWGLDCCGYGCIRKLTAETGVISTVAGGYLATNTGNNIPATSAFMFPFALRIDATGNIYMAEGGSEVRMINKTTGIISIVAGTADTGYSGDGGAATAAKLHDAQDIALDGDNNLYIADAIDNVIRKVDAASGIITTVVGNRSATFSGDGGPATAAGLNTPNGVYVDIHNNIYIADYYNSRVRMVSAVTGIITTVAGNGSATDSGYNGLATAVGIGQPVQVITDDKDNLFITGYESNRIRKVDGLTHSISTYAGCGAPAYTRDSLGDGGPALSAIISPWGMCFDTCGDLYFSDFISTVRAVVPELPTHGTVCNYLITTGIAGVKANAGGVTLYPNPNQGSFTITVSSDVTEPVKIVINDLLGQKIKELYATTNDPVEVELHEPPGIYFAEARTVNNSWQEKIILR